MCVLVDINIAVAGNWIALSSIALFLSFRLFCEDKNSVVIVVPYTSPCISAYEYVGHYGFSFVFILTKDIQIIPKIRCMITSSIAQVHMNVKYCIFWFNETLDYLELRHKHLSLTFLRFISIVQNPFQNDSLLKKTMTKFRYKTDFFLFFQYSSTTYIETIFLSFLDQ